MLGQIIGSICTRTDYACRKAFSTMCALMPSEDVLSGEYFGTVMALVISLPLSMETFLVPGERGLSVESLVAYITL